MEFALIGYEENGHVPGYDKNKWENNFKNHTDCFTIHTIISMGCYCNVTEMIL